jgi:hypothetical protein
MKFLSFPSFIDGGKNRPRQTQPLDVHNRGMGGSKRLSLRVKFDA